METFSYLGLSCVFFFVSILPMRHGNNISKEVDRMKIWLTFRSYLWGMETWIFEFSDVVFIHFDPTYEAWKLLLVMVIICLKKRFRSYLRGMETRFCFRYRILLPKYFDPTYEAWKLSRAKIGILHMKTISILPTRHGNSGWMTSPTFLVRISILPTRHGN